MDNDSNNRQQKVADQPVAWKVRRADWPAGVYVAQLGERPKWASEAYPLTLANVETQDGR